MENKEKIDLILDKVCKLTKENQLRWNFTEKYDRFVLKINYAYVYIEWCRLFSNVDFEIRNEDNQSCYQITYNDLQNGEQYKEMFHIIKKQCLDNDTTIDGILEEITIINKAISNAEGFNNFVERMYADSHSWYAQKLAQLMKEQDIKTLNQFDDIEENRYKKSRDWFLCAKKLGDLAKEKTKKTKKI